MNVEALIEAAKKIDAKMRLREEKEARLLELQKQLLRSPVDSPEEFTIREERNKLALKPDPQWDDELAELRRALTDDKASY